MIDVSAAIESNAVVRNNGRKISESEIEHYLNQGSIIIEIHQDDMRGRAQKLFAFPPGVNADTVAGDLIGGYMFGPQVSKITKEGRRPIREAAEN